MSKLLPAVFGTLVPFLLITTPASAISLRDVVISEVAWSGTQASSSDEWIELYNNTDFDVDISGWTLVGSGGSNPPNIVFPSKIIPAESYSLLERTDGSTTSVVECLTYTGALVDSGGTITLKDASGGVIDTMNGDGGSWPAGTGASGIPPRASMERISLTVPDSDSNWKSNDGVTRNGLDANGQPINGTPTSSACPDVVSAPSPTPSSTATPTPSPSPTSTSAPTLTPTKTPSPAPKILVATASADVEKKQEEDLVLGVQESQFQESTESSTSTLEEGSAQSKKPFLAVGLMVLGTAFLAVSGYAFLRERSSGRIKDLDEKIS